MGASRDPRQWWRTLPPSRLRPVPPRLRLPVRGLWLAALLLALGAQAGGLWRGFVQATVIDQRFAAVGLITSIAGDGIVSVHPATRGAIEAGMPPAGVVTAINGRPLAPDLPEEAIAARLTGAPGNVTLAIRTPEGRERRVTLVRSDAVRAETWRGAIGPVPAFLTVAAAGLIAAAALIGSAVLLVRRRQDPVALLLSLGFLLLAASLERPILFYEWLGADWLSSVIPSLWLGTLAAALPAFPDGRFVPRWGGWLALFSAPLALLLMFDDQLGELASAAGFAVALAAAATPFLRYRRTPPGLERQQLKWAACGFIGSILLLIASYCFFLLSEAGFAPRLVSAGAHLAMLCVINLSFVLLPLGVLVALLRFRLWDADAAIGRSLGYASVTLALGGTWAATAKIVEESLKAQVGAASEPVVAAISTVAAALIFQPLRSRVNAWIDGRFRSGVAALHALPGRLGIWQHGDSPEDVAERVLDGVIPALRACHAAMLIHRPGGYRLLRARGVAPEQVEAWLSARLDATALAVPGVDRSDLLFPVRLVLADGADPIGALLLGPRSDGSLYAADERAALAAVEVPLAAALRRAQQRHLRELRLGAVLAAIEHRLEALEGATVPVDVRRA